MSSPATALTPVTTTSQRGMIDPLPQPMPQPKSPFDKAVRFLSYLYLRRIPVLIGVVLVVFPVLALSPQSPVSSLLQNLFFLSTAGMFWTTVVVLLVSWSMLLTSRVVTLNGEERFGLAQKYTSRQLAKLTRSFWLVLLVGFPTIIGPFTQSRDFDYKNDVWPHAAAVIAGFFCAYGIMFLALFLAVLIAPRRTQTSALTFPCFPFMRKLLEWANLQGLFPGRFLCIGLWIRARLPRSLWVGYICPRGFLWGGQWLSLMFSLATFAVYYAIDIYARVWLGETTGVPALVFVLLLLLNINWIFSALAFFLDRYRIPLLIPILLLCLVDSFIPASDHYYTVHRGVTVQPVSALDVLESRAKQKKPIVIIATAGGGIQAAAWTTQVLAGLRS